MSQPTLVKKRTNHRKNFLINSQSGPCILIFHAFAWKHVVRKLPAGMLLRLTDLPEFMFNLKMLSRFFTPLIILHFIARNYLWLGFVCSLLKGSFFTNSIITNFVSLRIQIGNSIVPLDIHISYYIIIENQISMQQPPPLDHKAEHVTVTG